KFIRLNLINYFIEKDEYGEPVRCRAFRYDEIIQTKFIEGFREGEIPADDYGFEDWNGSVLILNEEGRKYFENYLFDVKKNYCRARDNYVYVLETLDEIEMKLGLLEAK
ncbi:TPA: hypothetical protein PW994_000506, partial [Mannheimia haemolytica]|nr:hypothetical protein [Mannheimia haemolytica]